MKKLLITLMAATAVAGGIPAAASAHPGEEAEYADNDWNNGGATYADFNEEYRHIWAGIQHGLTDGSYNRYEANAFYRQMQTIRYRAYYQQQRGYYDPEATQAQLERLHEQMHNAHERGHDRQDYYYGNRYSQNGYGHSYSGYNRNYYGSRDDRYNQGYSLSLGVHQ
jgi:hypothetical protein